MAHYVLSDIHGEGDRFHRMLEQIRFSREDTLYILGDVIDRGPDGIALLQEIMETPNMVMLLGNHEYMMERCFRPGATKTEHLNWDYNGNTPTLAAFAKLTPVEQERILDYLQSMKTHLRLELEGQRFYLVHGFPADNAYDEVWDRPDIWVPNPIPDCKLLIGHTPVLLYGGDEKALMGEGNHLRILHAPGFVDLDCGCGHGIPFRALACLRLEDGQEFYT